MKFFVSFLQDNNDRSFVGNYDVSKTLTFATQLNGGFAIASMIIPMPSTQGSMLTRAILGSIATVYDGLGRYVYNGRVSKAESGSSGVRVTCSGIFEDGGKKTVPTALWLSPTTTNGEVLSDCVALVDSWHGHAEYYLGAMNIPVGTQDYNDETKVNDMIGNMLKVGYQTWYLNAAYFVIYNDQIGQIIVERGIEYRDWLVPLGSKIGSSVGIKDIYNKIYVLYDDTAEDSVGPTMYPTPAEDLGSQGKYGEREGVLNVGEYGLALGLDLRDLAIQKYANPVPSVPVTTRGFVANYGGSYEPSYMVRAGDFIGIIDNDESAALNNLRSESTTGFVTSTSFSASSMESKYVLSNSDNRLDYLLARLGLSGGLS